MPELPEVERVRLSLAEHVIGQRIVDVTLHRAEVVEFGAMAARTKSAMLRALLIGQTITSLGRHGKQLAIIAGNAAASPDDQPTLCVHLGMTGSLVHQRPPLSLADTKHTHITWHLGSGACVYFHDPRRFGGVWTFASLAALRAARWAALGSDALTISPEELHAHLRRTQRHLKAALLDQSVIAGLGNIYVDELLFERRLHPMMKASRVKMNDVQSMVLSMRDLLGRAIASGGSSLRNYVDANGQAGGFQFNHLVYGRGGEPCQRCKMPLRQRIVGGRTTVFCASCQKRT